MKRRLQLWYGDSDKTDLQYTMLFERDEDGNITKDLWYDTDGNLLDYFVYVFASE